MTGELVITYVTALTTLFASGCVGLLEIFNSPERVNYPSARPHVRVAMFVWAVFLGYRGVEMITLALGPSPVFVTAGTFYASVTLALAQAAILEQHLRSWLPAHTHQRIQLLMDIARCKPGKVRTKGLSVKIV